jgi:hypothetical protein
MNTNPSNPIHWTSIAMDYWSSLGISLQAGAHLEEIARTESAVGFAFPADMRELYQRVNGFRNFDWTPGMISIWPLDRIRVEYLEGEDRNFVGFCDFLINSHCIGFVKDQAGIFKSYGGNHPLVFVADSFSIAIELINRDSELIY